MTNAVSAVGQQGGHSLGKWLKNDTIHDMIPVNENVSFVKPATAFCTIRSCRVFCFVSTVLMLLTTFDDHVLAAERLFMGLYGGQATSSSIKEIYTLEAETADSSIAAFFLGKEMGSYGNFFSSEMEGQIVKHTGDQDHWEFNGVFTLRWLPFPWDNTIDTSLAVGLGLSYATEKPLIEVEKNEESDELLAYLMIELDFDLPEQSNWSIFGRLHHRSGAWGVFDGVHGGSNILCAGLKYTFN